MSRALGLALAGALSICGVVGLSAGAAEPGKVMGANACAECHKQEVEAWKGTHHFKTFRDLPRNVKAGEIAQRMGVRRVKSERLCLSCHFTVQQSGETAEAVSGISCESCHSAAKDWIKVHSGFSGKTVHTESKAEAEARWRLAEAKGMIRPRAIYGLAKACYGCHAVTQEDLVNRGGHRAGSLFELVSWSQGEVRHNTWTSKGKENVPAGAARRRLLYLAGLSVELETALRGLAKATQRKVYAFEMAARADRARKALATAAKAVPAVPEIGRMVALAYGVKLKLQNEQALSEAAESVANEARSVLMKTDGSTLGGLDGLIPGPDKVKGEARKPGPAG